MVGELTADTGAERETMWLEGGGIKGAIEGAAISEASDADDIEVAG